MFLRYTISGIILLMVAYFSKAHLPSGRELWYTALYGVIIIGMGTGCLVFAEQWVPSGLAAVFITLSPFWMIGIDALIPGGERLHGPTIVAMLVGLAGTTLLVAPEIMREGFGGPLLRGFIVLANWRGRLVPRVHPPAASSNHGASGGHRRSATTWQRVSRSRFRRCLRGRIPPPGATAA